MKKILLLLVTIIVILTSCQKEPFENDIIGTWERINGNEYIFTIKKDKTQKYESYEMRLWEQYLSLEKEKVKTNLFYTSGDYERPAFIENDKLFIIQMYEKDYSDWMSYTDFSPGSFSQIKKDGGVWHWYMGNISMPNNDVLILTSLEYGKKIDVIYHRVK